MAQSHPEAVAFRLLFSWASLKLVATYNRVTCKSIVISSRNCVDSIELASHFLRRLLMVPNIPDWANSMLSVALLWSNHGPLAACHLAGVGPIPHYWPCLFQGKLGQSHAIGIVSLEGDWANLMPLVVPLQSDHGPSAVCHSAGAGPIPCYWHGLFGEGLGQLKATGSPSLENCWPSSTLLDRQILGEGKTIDFYGRWIFKKKLGQLDV